jgi:hypothetical protein
MEVSGKIISFFNLNMKSEKLLIFRALDQDKTRDSISSYKLLSDSSINEQGYYSNN